MSINFPNNPAVNDEYTFEGKTWVWTGSKWNFLGESSLPELYAENPSSPAAPSATGTNAVAIGSGRVGSQSD